MSLTRNQKIQIANVMVAIAEFYAVIVSLIHNGPSIFQYYTELSNLFSGVASAIVAYQLYKHGKINKKGKLLRYIATCGLTITFLVVITVLGPIYGYQWMLLSGTMLWTHTICPISVIFLFLFLEREPKLEKKHIFISVLPTLGYGVLAVIGNLVDLIVGPYPFLMVKEQSIPTSVGWFVGMISGAIVLSYFYYLWDQKKE